MSRLLLPVVLLAACGGVHAPPPTFARANLLPTDVSVVFGFDATKLRATPFWSKVGPKLTGLLGRHDRRDLDELRRRCDLDPLRDVHWAVVAADSRGRVDDAVLIVNGAWSDDKVARCAAGYGSHESDGDDDAEDKAAGAGFKHYGDAWFAWLAPDTAAIVFKRRSLPFLRRVVENKGPGKNTTLERHLARIDPNAMVWFAAARTGDDSDWHELDVFNTDVLAQAQGVSISVVFGNELHAKLVAEEPASAPMSELVQRAEKKLHRNLRDVPMLDKVKVTATSTQIEAALDIDAAAIDLLATMLVVEAERQLARSKDDDDDTPPPTPPEEVYNPGPEPVVAP